MCHNNVHSVQRGPEHIAVPFSFISTVRTYKTTKAQVPYPCVYIQMSAYRAILVSSARLKAVIWSTVSCFTFTIGFLPLLGLLMALTFRESIASSRSSKASRHPLSVAAMLLCVCLRSPGQSSFHARQRRSFHLPGSGSTKWPFCFLIYSSAVFSPDSGSLTWYTQILDLVRLQTSTTAYSNARIHPNMNMRLQRRNTTEAALNLST